MTTAPQPFEHIRFATIARAGEGLTQWRPLALGFAALLLSSAISAASAWMMFSMGVAGGLLALIGTLLAAVVFMAGISGVGAMLMDRAQQLPVRSFGDAAMFGLFCIPKFLGFSLLIGLAVLAFWLVAAIVYFVCKIPVLGGILAFFAHPILIVIGAACSVAVCFVVMPLFAPAVWSGLPMKAAIASVVGIARQRLVPVVLLQLVLYFVVGIISGLIMFGLLPVGIFLSGLGAAITGGDLASSAMQFIPGLGGGFGGGYGGYGGGYGRGYGDDGEGLWGSSAIVGILAGTAVLLTIVWALLVQVTILGLNLVYLQAQEGIDTSSTEGELDGILGDMRQRTQEAAQRTKEAAARAKEAAEKKAQELAAANAARRAQAAEAKAQAASAAAAAAMASTSAAHAQPQAHSTPPLDETHTELKQEIAALAAQAQAQAQTQADQAEADAELAKEQIEHPEANPTPPQTLPDTQQIPPAGVEPTASTPGDAAPPHANTPTAMQCPACHHPVTAADVFCGECGHKLK